MRIKKGSPPQPSEAVAVGSGGRNGAGAVSNAMRLERSGAKFLPAICRYCGGKIIKTKSRVLYGKGNQTIYLCTMCNAYVGCYEGTDKPMGKVANTVLRLKRQETHQVFDTFWQGQGWTRSAAYRWLARELHLSEENAHIGMMEMDECEAVIRLCQSRQNTKETA